MHIKQDMIDFVIDLLKNRIPPTYYYHNYEHSLYVMQKAIEIGKHENCTEKELELSGTAGLWHDTGYINIYKGHEEESCRLANQYLPGYGYSTGEINTICGMIMATKIPHQPTSKLEEILADADMEYLGTSQAAIHANNLSRELKTLNPELTEEAWNKTEIEFLQQHRFFTDWCIQNSKPGKLRYLDKLMSGG